MRSQKGRPSCIYTQLRFTMWLLFKVKNIQRGEVEMRPIECKPLEHDFSIVTMTEDICSKSGKRRTSFGNLLKIAKGEKL